jgi:hypothetical protein
MTYDLYGTDSPDMDALRHALEAALGIEFEARWSDFLGGDYYSWRPGDPSQEHLRIIRNHHYDADPDHDEEMVVAEPEFNDYKLLLRVEGTTRGDHIRDRLSTVLGLVFLRRSEAVS